MNRKAIWVIIFLVAVTGALLLWLRVSIQTETLPQPLPIPSAPPLSVQTPTPSVTVSPVPPTSVVNIGNAEAKREQKFWSSAFMTPITFYGKVVDEKGNPISDAKALIQPTDSFNGASQSYQKITDAGGLFSISGIHGLSVVIMVSKDGYYSLPQSQGSFGYVAGTNNSPPHTNSADPAVFVLRKMGEAESLIVHKIDRVGIASNGAPREINLTTGKVYNVTNGDIQIESWAGDAGRSPNSNAPFDWKCQISVPGGGLTPGTGGQFNFEAPTEGYQNADIIDMPTSASQWSSDVTRNYFIKLPSGQYARMIIEIFAGGNQFVNITTYLNPTPGDRNLEFDPTKIIQAQ